MKYFVADFETTSFKQYQIDGETRVFMWSITDVETLKVVQRGLTIEEFSRGRQRQDVIRQQQFTFTT